MSSQETVPQAAEPVSGKGLGVVPLLLSSPSEAFRRLAGDPQWIGQCVLVLLMLGLAAWVRLPQSVAVQYESTEAVMERMGADDASIDEALARIPDPDNLTVANVASAVASTVGGAGAVSFLGVLVFWVLGKVSGPQPGFRQASAVFWTASLAGGVGYLVLSLIVRMTDSVEASLSPAALVPGLDWGSPVWAFLNVFDIFSVATLYLLAVGARRTFSTTKSTGWMIAGIYWTLASALGFASTLAASWAMGRA